MQGVDLFSIPKPFGRARSWQAVRGLEFRAKFLSAMVSAYLLKLLALLTPERMRRALPYLVVDSP